MAGGCGHGCGHNMLGAGAMAAAFGIKKYLEKKGEGHGTVIFFGCPGEEGGASKAFMARDGVWKDLDAALTWHPSDVNQVTSGTCNSCIQTEYIFKGVASPRIRSAGVRTLRPGRGGGHEHGRAVFAGAHAGFRQNPLRHHGRRRQFPQRGAAPRQSALHGALQAGQGRPGPSGPGGQDRPGGGHDDGDGSAQQFIDGCSNTVPNRVLEQLLWDNFDQVGVDTYTPEEMEYAKKIMDSYEMKSDRLPGAACDEDEAIAAFVDEKSQHGTRPMNDFLIPYHYSDRQRAGSTDVGDVSWLTPTAQINAASFVSKAPGHSWQNGVLRPHLHRSQERDHRRKGAGGHRHGSLREAGDSEGGQGGV